MATRGLSGRRALHGALLLLLTFWLPARDLAGWDRGVAARRLLRAADAQFNRREYRKALSSYRSALSSEAPRGLPRDEHARVLSQLAEAAEKAGQYRQSLEAWRQRLWLDLEAGDSRTAGQTLRRLGETHTLLGEYAEGLRILRLPSAASGYTGDGREQSASLSAQALALGALGRYAEQEEAATRALDLARAAGSGEAAAAALEALAVYHESQGDLDRALAEAREALRLARESRQPDLAPAFLVLAAVQRARGEIREAAKTSEEALEAARAGGVEEAVAVARSRLGLEALCFGEFDRARREFEAALGAFEQAGAIDDAARMHLELGRAFYLEQRYSDAESRLTSAATLYRRGTQPIGAAVVASALGRVLLAQGRPAEALVAHDRALSVFESAGEATGIAQERLNRGFALLALERLDEAASAFEATKTAVGGDLELPWRRAQGRARLLLRRGDRPGAVTALLEAVEIVEKLLVRNRIPEFRSSFLGGFDRLSVHDEAIDSLARLGRAEEAFEIAERSRARSFLDLAGSSGLDLRAGADPRLLEQERRLRDAIALATREGEAATVRLAELRAEHSRLLERFAVQDPALAGLVTVERLESRAACRMLSPGETLLLYHLGGGTAPRVFLLSAAGVETTTLPATRSEIRGLVGAYRIQIEGRMPSRDLSERLHEVLIGPIEKRLAGTRRLIVAPHDSLHYLPFAALTDGGGRSLVERWPLSIVPSASALRLLAGAGSVRPGRAGGGRLLAVGDPTAGGGLEPLPSARTEVARVAARFGQPRVYIGADATESAVKAALAGSDVIHLACHGLLQPELPLFSFLSLAPSPGEDGRLELHEIFGRKLGARLVVLSACQTAVGRISRGDELVCLARAFLHAGAPTVVASLWNVADEATAVLMDSFYAGLAGGAAPDEALRKASLDLARSEKYADPFLWSAFAVTGSPR